MLTRRGSVRCAWWHSQWAVGVGGGAGRARERVYPCAGADVDPVRGFWVIRDEQTSPGAGCR